MISDLDSELIPKSTQIIFRFFLSIILAPAHIIVSGLCFFSVIAIPMGRLNYVLLKLLYVHGHSLKVNSPSSQYNSPISTTAFDGLYNPSTESLIPFSATQHMVIPITPIVTESPHTRRKSLTPAQILDIEVPDFNIKVTAFHTSSSETIEEVMEPLLKSAIQFTPDSPEDTQRRELVLSSSGKDQIVLCIHHAIGFQYYKYTVDGVNIIFINLLSANVFCFIDYYILGPSNGFTGTFLILISIYN